MKIGDMIINLITKNIVPILLQNPITWPHARELNHQPDMFLLKLQLWMNAKQ